MSDKSNVLPSLRRRTVWKWTILSPRRKRARMFFSSVPTILGDDECNVFSDCLLGGIAEHVLSALIPALNDAIEVLADDGVVGGSNNGWPNAPLPPRPVCAP